MTTYEPVIGLEVHAELLTDSKMFCGCPVVDSTTAQPNTVVCPICAALPGMLPVVNAKAVAFATRVGLALHCTINPHNVFARKNYFYPDLPKGYQISQYELPLASHGYLDITTTAGTKRIRIRRVHLEEDTGKLFHIPNADGSTRASLVDLNRAGVPLLEIVTEPDLSNVEEVKAYAIALRSILRYLGVNTGDMEKGIIRFEANVSVRPVGSDQLNTRTEIKNLNSFRALVKGTEYEIERQTGIYQTGGSVQQQTLGWSEARNATFAQRSKEQAHDYRYFPEPDIPPLEIDPAWVAEIAAELPELPATKQARYQALGLTAYDADVIVSEPETASYFEDALTAAQGSPVGAKTIANWLTGELFGLINNAGKNISDQPVQPKQLVQLLLLLENKTINGPSAKLVLRELFDQGGDPATIVQAKGLAQVSDSAPIAAAIAKVLAANPNEIQSYLAGKETVANFLFGQVMKSLQGKANPQVIRSLLEAELQQRKAAA